MNPLNRQPIDPQPIEPQPTDIPQPATQPSPTIAKPTKRIPGWRLWLPLLFQAVLIAAVPARDAYTYVAGKPVILQTAPVDPYDLLRGYYQTLRYDISDPNLLKSLPGGEAISAIQGQTNEFYVVLEAPTQTNTTPPQPWKPVRISVDRPTNLSSNQTAIQGQYNGWQVMYGLETYYMPEDQRQQINTDISQVQLQSQEAFVVEAKVDTAGNAVPVSLWVRDRNYRF